MVAHFVRSQPEVVEWWFVGFDKVHPPNELKHSFQSLSLIHDAHAGVGRVAANGLHVFDRSERHRKLFKVYH
jgi:hypothetical protein